MELPLSVRIACNYIEIAGFFGENLSAADRQIPYPRLVAALSLLKMSPPSTDLDQLRVLTLGFARDSSVRQISSFVKRLK